MAPIDAFSAQIVELVRRMPDDAILALVRNQLGAVTGGGGLSVSAAPLRRAPRAAASVTAPAPVAAPAPAAAPRVVRPVGRPPRAAAAGGRPAVAVGRPSVGGNPQRQELLGTVERVVRGGSGLSASEIARAANAPQPRVALALKELKLAKRIFQGGDRRFARYAGDAKTAEQASLTARKTASGPAPSAKAGKRKGR